MVFILDLTFVFIHYLSFRASHSYRESSSYRAKPDNKILSAESRLNVSTDNKAEKNENSNTKQIQQHAFLIYFLLWFGILKIKL